MVLQAGFGLEIGQAFDDGHSGFVRSELSWRQSRMRFYWNQGRSRYRELSALGEPNLDYDTYDLNVERTLSLPWSQGLTLGASYRRNESRSSIYGPIGRQAQDLWALFFEHEWRPEHSLATVASARLDHHPLAGYSLSPRASLIYTLDHANTLRLSAGTAFRNPTLVEDYIDVSVFNLGDNEHFELLQQRQNGEIIRGRVLGRLSYRF
ncbi:MAG: TonB-dependent receptor [Elusimicrobia bacterium]|nr:TonB-dependent receptor [Elusimicrobiota bacterium]